MTEDDYMVEISIAIRAAEKKILALKMSVIRIDIDKKDRNEGDFIKELSIMLDAARNL